MDARIRERAMRRVERRWRRRKAGNCLTEADDAVSRLAQRCCFLVEDVERGKDQTTRARGNL
jgi:hypothetical protein